MEYKEGAVVLSLSAVSRGHEVYVYKEGAVRQLPASRFGASLEGIQGPRSVWYPRFDGRKIQANNYAPRRAARHCGVSTRGPKSQDRPEFKPPCWPRAFKLPRRITAALGKSFIYLDDVERRLDAVRDVETFAERLQVEGIARERPRVAGGSYGGYSPSWP